MAEKAVYVLGLSQVFEQTTDRFIPIEYNIMMIHPSFAGGSKSSIILIDTNVNWTSTQLENAKRDAAKDEAIRQTQDNTWANNDVYQMNVKRG